MLSSRAQQNESVCQEPVRQQLGFEAFYSIMSSFPQSVMSITSSRNAHYKRWMALHEAKGIKQHQQCLVSGKKLVQEMLSQHPELCLDLIHPHAQSTRFITTTSDIPQYQLTFDLFQKLDLLGTNFPLLVCDTPPITSADLTKPPTGLEVLCPIGDPNNLGALIRSCCAFDISKVILLKEAAHPFHPKSIRSSSGTMFHQPMCWGTGITDLKSKQVLRWISALDLKGQKISKYQWPKDVRLLVGEEGLGIPDFPFKKTLTIPQAKKANSLNATTAASIALFSYRQQYPL